MAKETTEEQRSEPMGALSAVGTSQDDFRVREFDHDMIADALAMRQLRAALDVFASEHGEGTEPDAKISLERSHAIALLTHLHAGLSDSLRRPANMPSDDEDVPEVVFEHPAMSLLRHFIGVLYDLDNAKTDAVFRPSVEPRGSPLWRHEVRWRDALLELVDVIKIDRNMKKRALAEQMLARLLKRSLGRAKGITAEQLHEMRKTRRRQRRRTEN